MPPEPAVSDRTLFHPVSWDEDSCPRLADQRLEADLRAALRMAQFSLHWQPVVTCASGDLLGFEALMRWDRPGYGPLAPVTFLPAIERLELYRDFDRWMLLRVCRAARSWPGLIVSVNVSAGWFSGTGLVAAVATVLEQSGLSPAQLELEISESATLADPGMTTMNMVRLKGLGVRLVLDDFGSGHASLGYLHDMPFDKLKLDRTFVSRLGRCRRTEVVVHAVLRMGAALGLTICADGVEREDQLAILQAYGCDEVQGHLIGRPCETVPNLLDLYDRLDQSLLFMTAGTEAHAIR